MPHLLAVWPQIHQRLKEAGRVLLFLDYDGTLAPIVDRPDLARLPQETRDALAGLNNRSPAGSMFPSETKLIIGIISARSLDDVSARVGIDGLIYAGNHGLEIRGPGLEFVHPQAILIRDTLDQAYLRLKQELRIHPGAFAEHKGLSLTVHYRLVVDESVEAVKDTVEKTILPFVENGELVVSSGKMALEIRPNISWDKGSSISTIWAALTNPSAARGDLALYFGDDLPDEAGFATVQEAGGIGVFVGPPDHSTCAQFHLDSPQEVGNTLTLIQHSL